MRIIFGTKHVELYACTSKWFDIGRREFMRPGFALRIGNYMLGRPSTVGAFQLINLRTFDFDAHIARHWKNHAR